MNNPVKTIKIVTIIAFAMCIGAYTLYETRNLIIGPRITISEPQSGSTVEKAMTTIQGQAKNISYISLNNKQIFIDEEGVFKEKFILSDGYNTVQISAKDKFGREKKEILELVYKAHGQNFVLEPIQKSDMSI